MQDTQNRPVETTDQRRMLTAAELYEVEIGADSDVIDYFGRLTGEDAHEQRPTRRLPRRSHRGSLSIEDGNARPQASADRPSLLH